MKKLSFLAIAFAVIAMAACGGKKSAQAEEATDSVKSLNSSRLRPALRCTWTASLLTWVS